MSEPIDYDYDAAEDCHALSLNQCEPGGMITWQKSLAPPIGIYPRHLWQEDNPNPSDDELRIRWVGLGRAILRYEVAGWSSRPCVDEWRREIDDIRRLLVARRYKH